MSPRSLDARFNGLVEELAKSSHGSAKLGEVKKFLDKELKGTANRESFLLPKLLQEAAVWEDVKDSVWKSEKAQKENKFPFLQGDVIGTEIVMRLGEAESSQKHGIWLVLAPDCDCVRSSFIRVAPIFPVYSGRKSTEAKQRFGHSLKLSTLKAFPLPKLPSDTEGELRGYFADFEEPFYIEQASAPIATPYASMTVTGWHLLNAIIQEKETRAVNMEEAVAIRSRGTGLN